MPAPRRPVDLDVDKEGEDKKGDDNDDEDAEAVTGRSVDSHVALHEAMGSA